MSEIFGSVPVRVFRSRLKYPGSAPTQLHYRVRYGVWPVTDEEIREILFRMPSEKSPGPDGYTAKFFKASWSIISKEFTTAVHSFFRKGFLPKGLNTTILALIPKKDDAMEMRNYRPRACCNVLYKVISKIIANRLKCTLPRCISYNQSAFLKDRLLVENILLATEIVKDYNKEDISPKMCNED